MSDPSDPYAAQGFNWDPTPLLNLSQAWYDIGNSMIVEFDTMQAAVTGNQASGWTGLGGTAMAAGWSTIYDSIRANSSTGADPSLIAQCFQMGEALYNYVQQINSAIATQIQEQAEAALAELIASIFGFFLQFLLGPLLGELLSELFAALDAMIAAVADAVADAVVDVIDVASDAAGLTDDASLTAAETSTMDSLASNLSSWLYTLGKFGLNVGVGFGMNAAVNAISNKIADDATGLPWSPSQVDPFPTDAAGWLEMFGTTAVYTGLEGAAGDHGEIVNADTMAGPDVVVHPDTPIDTEVTPVTTGITEIDSVHLDDAGITNDLPNLTISDPKITIDDEFGPGLIDSSHNTPELDQPPSILTQGDNPLNLTQNSVTDEYRGSLGNAYDKLETSVREGSDFDANTNTNANTDTSPLTAPSENRPTVGSQTDADDVLGDGQENAGLTGLDDGKASPFVSETPRDDFVDKSLDDADKLTAKLDPEDVAGELSRPEKISEDETSASSEPGPLQSEKLSDDGGGFLGDEKLSDPNVPSREDTRSDAAKAMAKAREAALSRYAKFAKDDVEAAAKVTSDTAGFDPKSGTGANAEEDDREDGWQSSDPPEATARIVSMKLIDRPTEDEGAGGKADTGPANSKKQGIGWKKPPGGAYERWEVSADSSDGPLGSLVGHAGFAGEPLHPVYNTPDDDTALKETGQAYSDDDPGSDVADKFPGAGRVIGGENVETPETLGPDGGNNEGPSGGGVPSKLEAAPGGKLGGNGGPRTNPATRGKGAGSSPKGGKAKTPATKQGSAGSGAKVSNRGKGSTTLTEQPKAKTAENPSGKGKAPEAVPQEPEWTPFSGVGNRLGEEPAADAWTTPKAGETQTLEVPDLQPTGSREPVAQPDTEPATPVRSKAGEPDGGAGKTRVSGAGEAGAKLFPGKGNRLGGSRLSALRKMAGLSPSGSRLIPRGKPPAARGAGAAKPATEPPAQTRQPVVQTGTKSAAPNKTTPKTTPETTPKTAPQQAAAVVAPRELPPANLGTEPGPDTAVPENEAPSPIAVSSLDPPKSQSPTPQSQPRRLEDEQAEADWQNWVSSLRSELGPDEGTGPLPQISWAQVDERVRSYVRSAEIEATWAWSTPFDEQGRAEYVEFHVNQAFEHAWNMVFDDLGIHFDEQDGPARHIVQPSATAKGGVQPERPGDRQTAADLVWRWNHFPLTIGKEENALRSAAWNTAVDEVYDALVNQGYDAARQLARQQGRDRGVEPFLGAPGGAKPVEPNAVDGLTPTTRYAWYQRTWGAVPVAPDGFCQLYSVIVSDPVAVADVLQESYAVQQLLTLDQVLPAEDFRSAQQAQQFAQAFAVDLDALIAWLRDPEAVRQGATVGGQPTTNMRAARIRLQQYLLHYIDTVPVGEHDIYLEDAIYSLRDRVEINAFRDIRPGVAHWGGTWGDVVPSEVNIPLLASALRRRIAIVSVGFGRGGRQVDGNSVVTVVGPPGQPIVRLFHMGGNHFDGSDHRTAQDSPLAPPALTPPQVTEASSSSSRPLPPPLMPPPPPPEDEDERPITPPEVPKEKPAALLGPAPFYLANGALGKFDVEGGANWNEQGRSGGLRGLNEALGKANGAKALSPTTLARIIAEAGNVFPPALDGPQDQITVAHWDKLIRSGAQFVVDGRLVRFDVGTLVTVSAIATVDEDGKTVYTVNFGGGGSSTGKVSETTLVMDPAGSLVSAVINTALGVPTHGMLKIGQQTVKKFAATSAREVVAGRKNMSNESVRQTVSLSVQVSVDGHPLFAPDQAPVLETGLTLTTPKMYNEPLDPAKQASILGPGGEQAVNDAAIHDADAQITLAALNTTPAVVELQRQMIDAGYSREVVAAATEDVQKSALDEGWLLNHGRYVLTNGALSEPVDVPGFKGRFLVKARYAGLSRVGGLPKTRMRDDLGLISSSGYDLSKESTAKLVGGPSWSSIHGVHTEPGVAGDFGANVTLSSSRELSSSFKKELANKTTLVRATPQTRYDTSFTLEITPLVDQGPGIPAFEVPTSGEVDVPDDDTAAFEEAAGRENALDLPVPNALSERDPLASRNGAAVIASASPDVHEPSTLARRRGQGHNMVFSLPGSERLVPTLYGHLQPLIEGRRSAVSNRRTGRAGYNKLMADLIELYSTPAMEANADPLFSGIRYQEKVNGVQVDVMVTGRLHHYYRSTPRELSINNRATETVEIGGGRKKQSGIQFNAQGGIDKKETDAVDFTLSTLSGGMAGKRSSAFKQESTVTSYRRTEVEGEGQIHDYQVAYEVFIRVGGGQSETLWLADDGLALGEDGKLTSRPSFRARIGVAPQHSSSNEIPVKQPADPPAGALDFGGGTEGIYPAFEVMPSLLRQAGLGYLRFIGAKTENAEFVPEDIWQLPKELLDALNPTGLQASFGGQVGGRGARVDLPPYKGQRQWMVITTVLHDAQVVKDHLAEQDGEVEQEAYLKSGSSMSKAKGKQFAGSFAFNPGVEVKKKGADGSEGDEFKAAAGFSVNREGSWDTSAERGNQEVMRATYGGPSSTVRAVPQFEVTFYRAQDGRPGRAGTPVRVNQAKDQDFEMKFVATWEQLHDLGLRERPAYTGPARRQIDPRLSRYSSYPQKLGARGLVQEITQEIARQHPALASNSEVAKFIGERYSDTSVRANQRSLFGSGMYGFHPVVDAFSSQTKILWTRVTAGKVRGGRTRYLGPRVEEQNHRIERVSGAGGSSLVTDGFQAGVDLSGSGEDQDAEEFDGSLNPLQYNYSRDGGVNSSSAEKTIFRYNTANAKGQPKDGAEAFEDDVVFHLEYGVTTEIPQWLRLAGVVFKLAAFPMSNLLMRVTHELEPLQEIWYRNRLGAKTGTPVPVGGGVLVFTVPKNLTVPVLEDEDEPESILTVANADAPSWTPLGGVLPPVPDGTLSPWHARLLGQVLMPIGMPAAFDIAEWIPSLTLTPGRNRELNGINGRSRPPRVPELQLSVTAGYRLSHDTSETDLLANTPQLLTGGQRIRVRGKWITVELEITGAERLTIAEFKSRLYTQKAATQAFTKSISSGLGNTASLAVDKASITDGATPAGSLESENGESWASNESSIDESNQEWATGANAIYAMDVRVVMTGPYGTLRLPVSKGLYGQLRRDPAAYFEQYAPTVFGGHEDDPAIRALRARNAHETQVVTDAATREQQFAQSLKKLDELGAAADAARAEVTKLDQDVADAEKLLAGLGKVVTGAQNALKDARDAQALALKGLEAAEGRVRQATRDIKDLFKQIDVGEQILAAYPAEFKRVADEIERLGGQMESAGDELKAIVEEREAAKSGKDGNPVAGWSAQAEAAARARVDGYARRLEELQHENVRMEEEQQFETTVLDDRKSELPVLEGRLQQSQLDLGLAQDESDEAGKAVERAEKALELAQTEYGAQNGLRDNTIRTRDAAVVRRPAALTALSAETGLPEVTPDAFADAYATRATALRDAQTALEQAQAAAKVVADELAAHEAKRAELAKARADLPVDHLPKPIAPPSKKAKGKQRARPEDRQAAIDLVWRWNHFPLYIGDGEDGQEEGWALEVARNAAVDAVYDVLIEQGHDAALKFAQQQGRDRGVPPFTGAPGGAPTPQSQLSPDGPASSSSQSRRPLKPANLDLHEPEAESEPSPLLRFNELVEQLPPAPRQWVESLNPSTKNSLLHQIDVQGPGLVEQIVRGFANARPGRFPDADDDAASWRFLLEVARPDTVHEDLGMLGQWPGWMTRLREIYAEAEVHAGNHDLERFYRSVAAGRRHLASVRAYAVAEQMDDALHSPRDVMRYLTRELSDWLRTLYQGAAASLGLTDYVLLGVGSVGREEMFPRSDVDYSVLLSEVTDQVVAKVDAVDALIALQLTEMGEPDLDKFSKGLPEDVAEQHLVTMRGVLLDARTLHLAGNGRELEESYYAARGRHLRNERQRQEVATMLIATESTTFSPHGEYLGYEDKDVKKGLLRLPTFLVRDLALHYGRETAELDVWSRVDDLVEQDLLSPELATEIRFVVDFASTLRIRLHNFYQSENETFRLQGDVDDSYQGYVLNDSEELSFVRAQKANQDLFARAKEFSRARLTTLEDLREGAEVKTPTEAEGSGADRGCIVRTTEMTLKDGRRARLEEVFIGDLLIWTRVQLDGETYMVQTNGVLQARLGKTIFKSSPINPFGPQTQTQTPVPTTTEDD